MNRKIILLAMTLLVFFGLNGLAEAVDEYAYGTTFFNIADVIAPDNVGFLAPTPANNTNLPQDNYFVNASFNDTNPETCWLELTNYSGKINYTMTQGANQTEYYINITGQNNYLTFFTAYCNDTVGNLGSSNVRFVRISVLITSVIPSGIMAEENNILLNILADRIEIYLIMDDMRINLDTGGTEV